MQIVCKEY